jgi:hypothetical protein
MDVLHPYLRRRRTEPALTLPHARPVLHGLTFFLRHTSQPSRSHQLRPLPRPEPFLYARLTEEGRTACGRICESAVYAHALYLSLVAIPTHDCHATQPERVGRRLLRPCSIAFSFWTSNVFYYPLACGVTLLHSLFITRAGPVQDVRPLGLVSYSERAHGIETFEKSKIVTAPLPAPMHTFWPWHAYGRQTGVLCRSAGSQHTGCQLFSS